MLDMEDKEQFVYLLPSKLAGECTVFRVLTNRTSMPRINKAS
jgi:hypothetical protein